MFDRLPDWVSSELLRQLCRHVSGRRRHGGQPRRPRRLAIAAPATDATPALRRRTCPSDRCHLPARHLAAPSGSAKTPEISSWHPSAPCLERARPTERHSASPCPASPWVKQSTEGAAILGSGRTCVPAVVIGSERGAAIVTVAAPVGGVAASSWTSCAASCHQAT